MNTMKWILGAAGSAAFLFALSSPPAVRGELPPDAYEKMQEEAAEALEVQITSVKTMAGKNDSHVTAEAKILGVQRSMAGLKKDETLVIEYGIFDVSKKGRGWAGPGSPPLVKKGGEYTVFLKASKGKSYEIAAMSRSFLAVAVVKLALGNGKVLSVLDDSEEAGAQIVVAKEGTSLAQQWKVVDDGKFLRFVNRKSGKVLDVFEDSVEEDAKIILWDEELEGADNQRWSWDYFDKGLERAMRLKSKSSNLVLDVDDQGNVIQKKANATAASQVWTVKDVK